MNRKFFFGFVSLLVIIFGTLCWADTNGVWHEAEDVRGGTFGSDEQDVTTGYTFVNPVTINTAGGRGLFSTSSVDDGIGGVTSATGKSAIYGWANNPASYSGYFEGGNFVVRSGNVGIGPIAPTEKLDVEGNIRIRGRTSCGKLYTDASGNVLCGTDAGDTDWMEIGGNVYRISGNVGIGNTDAEEKLDVSGDLRLRGKGSCSKLYTDYRGKVLCGVDEGSNWLTSYSGDNIYRLSGNVGIGTPSPSAKLEVSGETIIGGRLIVNGVIASLNSVTISHGDLSVYDGDLSVNGEVESEQIATGRRYYMNYYMVPKGSIIMWSGYYDEIPPGWYLCNGQTVDGYTTPDLQGRFIVGYTYHVRYPSYSLNSIGGLASHSHDFSGTTLDGVNPLGVAVAWGPGDSSDIISGAGHNHQYSGVTSEESNLPPYYALAFIIRL